jgi:hypothetical protein
MMTGLKLLALDSEDLSVISTHMQDSVFKPADVAFEARHSQFSLSANRFVWENTTDKSKPLERRRSLLVFKRVLAVRSQGVNRTNPDQVLSLLAIRFVQKADGPDGTVEFTFSGGGAIALDVECIEAQLADIGGAWETASRPDHSGEE